VVQLYVSTPGAAPELERPHKRLVGFAKVNVQPGQRTRVEIRVAARQLAFFDEREGRFRLDPGEYRFQIGATSAGVTVDGTLSAVPAVLTAEPAAGDDAALGITGRVIFPVGAVVDPQLTVAMTDDSLYGYLRPGQGRALPPELTVTYTTKRPEVVAVAEDGTIRTVGSGVATVTATATYQATVLSTDFVVRVA
jgi:beta-glucosidase